MYINSKDLYEEIKKYSIKTLVTNSQNFSNFTDDLIKYIEKKDKFMKILHVVGGSFNNGAFKGAKILHDSLINLNVDSKILNIIF